MHRSWRYLILSDSSSRTERRGSEKGRYTPLKIALPANAKDVVDVHDDEDDEAGCTGNLARCGFPFGGPLRLCRTCVEYQGCWRGENFVTHDHLTGSCTLHSPAAWVAKHVALAATGLHLSASPRSIPDIRRGPRCIYKSYKGISAPEEDVCASVR